MRNARDLRRDRPVKRVLCIQRIQNRDGALQGVDAAAWDGGVGHLAVHRHFHLQAAVVRGDDFIAEAGRDHEVGAGQSLLQEPARTQQTAEFLVIRKVQLHRAARRHGDGFQRPQRKREAGEVALADGCGAAVQAAVLDLGAVGIVLPAVAGGHHIAVRVERDARACAAVFAAHDEVGDGLHAVVRDGLGRHGVRFGVQAKILQQLRGALGVRGVVAGRRVGGHAHQCLQEADFFVEMGVHPGVESGVIGHGVMSRFRWPARRASPAWLARQVRYRRWWWIRGGCG